MAEFPIVGIGSSAGGLEALEKLFSALPSDTGAAFVVVAHLDPTRESHLTELLSRRTEMPVAEVQGETRVEPNHAYVIAPDQDLRLNGDVLHPSKPSEPRGQRRPVDTFFRSLAENGGARAIGIVLSGTGTNGTQGLRLIKAEGGIAIAQDPETAAYDGMPQSAIGTGIVDLVLPPEKIPEALLDLVRHPYVRRPEAVDQPDVDDHLNALLALLRTQTRLDFRPYKRQMLLRRTYRRMGLHRIEAFGEYLGRLRNDRQEVKALARDLTITVSGFYRDPQAWKALDEKVVAPLVQERAGNAAIRIWVPGCATGEEAYSLAMLIGARADQARKSFDLKIFATDVSEHVLATARTGLYPASTAGDVGADLLERFFEVEGDRYQVKVPLRETLTFAPQNLLQDPPFSRLDLISCRNLLIYLEPEFQRRVLALLHFALREDGHLFLGPAESVSGQESLFQAVSKKWRIFRRLGPTRHDIVDFPLVGRGDRSGETDSPPAPTQPEARRPTLSSFQRTLLERYAPASVLTDREFRTRAFQGPTSDYLQQPGGEPTGNLIALAREGLQVPLRSAVQRALAEDQEVSTRAYVKRGSSFHPVRITASPLGHGDDAMLAVSFFEEKTSSEASESSEVGDPRAESRLETELVAAREDLRLSIEQMEASNEELKASNEEIRSINEELTASNEELETSKEELQSLNEELNTVNSQLQAKIGELEARTDDLNNLLNSTDVATLFLDRSLCIRWFTPSMKALLELLSTDIGRPISHFARRFSDGDLLEEARDVLERLLPSDAEVVDDLGRWYIRHIVPYRTATDRIDGVIVTFIDITDRKRAEQAVLESERQARNQLMELETLYRTAPVGLAVLDRDLRYQRINRVLAEINGLDPEAHLGRSCHEVVPEIFETLDPVLRRVLASGEAITDVEVSGVTPARPGEVRHWLSDYYPLKDEAGTSAVGVVVREITDRKRMEHALREHQHRLAMAIEAIGGGVYDHAVPIGPELYHSERWAEILGYNKEELPPYGGFLDWFFAQVHPDDRDALDIAYTGFIEGRTPKYEVEIRIRHKDGDWVWVRGFAHAIARDVAGRVTRVIGVMIDITQQKQSEEERELLAQELSHRVKNVLAVVQALAMQTKSSGSVEEYRDSFVGRLSALARAHSLLLDTQWRSADLKELVRLALQAYRVDHPDVIEIEGESVALRANQALGLNLILHELGTNAAKYGSLSRQEGRVHVSWWVEERDSDRCIHLLWQERGGPQVQSPGEKGFGTRLIERACTYELEGEVELEYAPGGLRCEVWLPVT